MSYRSKFLNTLQLFRGSGLLWMLGAVVVLSDILFRISRYSLGNAPVPWIAYPLFLTSLYLSLVAKGSLIHATHQLISGREPGYAEAWRVGKTKVKRILWLCFLSIPVIIFVGFLLMIVGMSAISTTLTSAVNLLATILLASLFTFSICAIVIHDLGAGRALWAGLSILTNHFLQVIFLNIIFLILEIVLNVSSGIAFLGTIFVAPLTVTMTLLYREVTATDSTAVRSSTQPTA